MTRIRFIATMALVACLVVSGACGEPVPTRTTKSPTDAGPAIGPSDTPNPPTSTSEPPSVTPAATQTSIPTATSPPPTESLVRPSVTPTPKPPTATPSAAATPDNAILFSVYPEGDIALVNIDGSNRTLLLDRTMPGDVFTDRYAAWKPDGKSISYALDDFEEVEIRIMDVDGTNARRLVGEVAPVTSHSWAPDGRRIAYVSLEHGICILDLAEQSVTRLTEGRLTDERDPDWSPDGSMIAFSASDGWNHDIYIIQPDGTGLTRITSHEARDRHPDWSPDGTAIAFSSARRSPRYPDIYLLDLNAGPEGEGNLPLQLTAQDKLEIRPDWSPGGSWLVYLAHELGAEHGTIYAVNVDGRQLVQVTPDNVYHSPRWRP